MNTVTVDAMHYERLVRDSVKYEQLRALMIKSVEFSKWYDKIRLDDDNILEGLVSIFSSSEFSDLKSRYDYLKAVYEEEKRKTEEEQRKAEESEEVQDGESTL